jgi:hypothetical protein
MGSVRCLRRREPKIGLHTNVRLGCDHRLSSVHDRGFYRDAEEEGLIGHLPAIDVQRPGSTTEGL